MQTGGLLDTDCQSLSGTGSFTLEAGSVLGICDPAGISATGSTGAVQVSGTRSFSADARYRYTGRTAQVTGTGLPAQVVELQTSSPGGLTLSAPVAVGQNLILFRNLTTNNQALTLRSNAAGTATLFNASFGGAVGTVTGNVTVERYLDPARNAATGYRHLSAPVSGQTVASFGATNAGAAAYNASATPGTVTPFPTAFFYDAARQSTSPATTLSTFDKGWMAPQATDAAPVGTRAFTVQLPGASTLTFTGALTQTATALPLTRNLAGTAADGGWNLVGNPYAASLDFSTITAAQRTNMDASVYIYESTGQYAGTYRTYLMPSAGNPGVGSQPLAGSSQGFFVRVSDNQPAGSLNLTNDNRTPASQVVRRGTADTRPTLALTLAGNGAADELTVYSTAGATTGFDANYDAAKLANPTGLNLASLTAAGQQLAIDGRADFATATAIPLFVGLPAAGTYTLSAATLANLTDTRVELVDNLTGTRTALTAGTSYAFTSATTTAPGRFVLNLRPGTVTSSGSATLAAQVRAYPNPVQPNGQLIISRPAGGAASAVLLNAVGQQLRTVALPTTETTLNLTGLPAGVYALRVTLAGGQTVVQRVVVQ